jgi:hypothetical protein
METDPHDYGPARSAHPGGSWALGERQVEERQQRRRRRQIPIEDVGPAKPGHFIGVAASDPLTRLPDAANGYERVVVADPAVVLALDRIDDGQSTGWFGDNAGLFEEFAQGPLSNSFALFENAARKAPAPGHRRVRASYREGLVTAQNDRQHPDERALRIATGITRQGH